MGAVFLLVVTAAIGVAGMWKLNAWAEATRDQPRPRPEPPEEF